jgi:ATP-binding cassette, subfamily G (WHITE), member 2, PDR
MRLSQYPQYHDRLCYSGLNVEQRKRLTIGVELVAKPALLLFLDEPTSGLDSQTAWSICALLRKLANNGQAILCTIHQPSAMLFQEFDRCASSVPTAYYFSVLIHACSLLFLQSGGRPVYFGDIGKNSRILIDYFEAQGAPPCPPDANPAEWMLHVIGAAPGAVANKDYADAWRKSEECTEIKRELVIKRALSHGVPPMNKKENKLALAEFAAPFMAQFTECCYRVFQQYWRDPSYLWSKFFLVSLTVCLSSTSFANHVDRNSRHTGIIHWFLVLSSR